MKNATGIIDVNMKEQLFKCHTKLLKMLYYKKTSVIINTSTFNRELFGEKVQWIAEVLLNEIHFESKNEFNNIKLSNFDNYIFSHSITFFQLAT